MDRVLFDAVQQKLTEQWPPDPRHGTQALTSDRTNVRRFRSSHGPDPRHQGRVRYRYYVSLPHLYGESKTASVGSVSPFRRSTSKTLSSILSISVSSFKKRSQIPAYTPRRSKVILEQVARIDVHEDRLAIRFEPAETKKHLTRPTTIYSQSVAEAASRKPGRFCPDGIPKSEVRPTRIERRARLVNAIARGRRWLDEIVSGSVTDIKQIATRQKCSARQVNMTSRSRSRTRSRAGGGRRSFATRIGVSDFVMLRQNGAAVRSPRTESAIIADRAQNGAFGLQDSQYSRAAKGIAVETLRGERNFGCRDGRLKSA